MTTPKYDINSDDPLEMIWAVREKIYEETKDMTREEKTELLRKTREKFSRERELYLTEKRRNPRPTLAETAKEK